MSEIKKCWIVCGMDGNVLYTPDGEKPQEFSKESAAIKRAKEHVRTNEDSEAWVYELSHVVERPAVEPTVTKLK